MTRNGKKPKVVLFHPHAEAGKYNTCQRLPLDIMSISAIPEQRGYEIVIVDATVRGDYRRRVLDECEDAICFGATSIFGYQAYNSYVMAREVKEKFPSLPVVVGGWFPSVKPEMILNQGGAEIVVIGQGERTFIELLEALRSGSSLDGIDGLAYKNGDEITFNPPRKIEDLNKLPPMPYHMVNFDEYWDSDPYERIKRLIYASTGKDYSSTKIRSLDYFSSYGCPDECTFCTSATVTGRRWTAIEAGRMVDEIDHLVKKHHFNVITFVDANWGVSEKRVLEFCEGLLNRGIKIHWGASVEAHVFNKFDKKVVDLMAESGCVCLFFGAESADPVTLKMIKKNIKPGDVFQACETSTKRGIAPEVSYIVGYPDESEESVQSTIEEGCEILYRWPQIELPIMVFRPLPKTPLHERAIELGLPPVESIEYWSGYKRFGTNMYNSFNQIHPELYSSITQKQLKTLWRCQHYYFWYGGERLKLRSKLNIFEKILNKTSLFRLKHKLLGFPIEYKIYNAFCKFYNFIRPLK